MKKITTKLGLSLVIVSALALSSCTVNTHTLSKNTAQVKFAPIKRSDFTIIGGLKAEATITKKGAKLNRKQSKNYMMGDLVQLTAIESATTFDSGKKYKTYYAGGIKNDLIPVQKSESMVKSGFGKIKVVRDIGMDFALQALMKKYPDMDYFSNIQIDRKVTIKGKKTTEVIKIACNGIELRTD